MRIRPPEETAVEVEPAMTHSPASAIDSPPTESGRPGASTSLMTAIHVWKRHLADDGLAENTVKAFTADLNLLARYVGAGRALGDIGTSDLQAFLEWMRTARGVPCSPKTYARRVTSLKAFFRFMHQKGVWPEDPAAPLVQKTVISPLPEVLSPGEVEAARGAAREMRAGHGGVKPDARPAALLELLLKTGIKKGECLGLKLSHVDISLPEAPFLFVRYTQPRMRFKERKIALDPKWVSLYREYLAQYKLTDRVFPWSPRQLEYVLEDVGLHAGLAKHLSFDMCRWTCAVRDRQAGADPDRLREKLGLSRIQWREIGRKIEKLSSPPL